MDICRTSYDFNTSHCPDHQVMGQTGAVSPGLCGTARAATEGEEQALVSGHFGCAFSVGTLWFWWFCEALVLEWEPPSDNGGADLVAYRVWLRPVFQENVLRSFVFLCGSFILMYPCQLVMTMTILSWRAIYLFLFFAAVVFLGSWFYAFLLLIFCCSAFLLL